MNAFATWVTLLSLLFSALNPFSAESMNAAEDVKFESEFTENLEINGFYRDLASRGEVSCDVPDDPKRDVANVTLFVRDSYLESLDYPKDQRISETNKMILEFVTNAHNQAMEETGLQYGLDIMIWKYGTGELLLYLDNGIDVTKEWSEKYLESTEGHK